MCQSRLVVVVLVVLILAVILVVLVLVILLVVLILAVLAVLRIVGIVVVIVVHLFLSSAAVRQPFLSGENLLLVISYRSSMSKTHKKYALKLLVLWYYLGIAFLCAKNYNSLISRYPSSTCLYPL